MIFEPRFFKFVDGACRRCWDVFKGCFRVTLKLFRVVKLFVFRVAPFVIFIDEWVVKLFVLSVRLEYCPSIFKLLTVVLLESEVPKTRAVAPLVILSTASIVLGQGLLGYILSLCVISEEFCPLRFRLAFLVILRTFVLSVAPSVIFRVALPPPRSKSPELIHFVFWPFRLIIAVDS